MLNTKIIDDRSFKGRAYDKDAALILIKKLRHSDYTYVLLVDLLTFLIDQKKQGYDLSTVRAYLIKHLATEKRLTHFVRNVEDLKTMVTVATADVRSTEARNGLMPIEWRQNNKTKYFNLVDHILNERKADMPVLITIMKELSVLLDDAKKYNSFLKGFHEKRTVKTSGTEARLSEQELARKERLFAFDLLEKMSDKRSTSARVKFLQDVHMNGYSLNTLKDHIEVYFIKAIPERLKDFIKTNTELLDLIQSSLLFNILPARKGQFIHRFNLCLKWQALPEREKIKLLKFAESLEELLVIADAFHMKNNDTLSPYAEYKKKRAARLAL